MRCLASASLALAGLLTVGSAAADVIGPPPTTCLDGSVGASDHGGPYCRPLRCSSDADCKDGRVCRKLALCVGTFSGGGDRPKGEPPPTYQDVIARCDKADRSACKCPSDSSRPKWGGATRGKCEALQVCFKTPPEGSVSPTTDKATDPSKKKPAGGEPSGSKTKSNCAAAGPTSIAVLVLALLFMLVSTRRRG